MTVLSDSQQTREEHKVIDGHQLRPVGAGSAGSRGLGAAVRRAGCGPDSVSAGLRPRERGTRWRLRGDQQHLDIAAGTCEPGLTVARLAPGGQVVLTDLAAEMLDIATPEEASGMFRRPDDYNVTVPG